MRELPDPQDYDTWVAVGHALSPLADKTAYRFFKAGLQNAQMAQYRQTTLVTDVATRFGKFARTSLNASPEFQAKVEEKRLFTGIVSHTSVARHILQLSQGSD